jgi:hypothetical protein
MAAGFFPTEYQEFPFKEGDLLVSQGVDERYSVNKILKIDKITLKAGDSISIQNQVFTSPVEDYLLVVSCSYGESEFSSFEFAKNAANSGNWTVLFGHIPNRTVGASIGQTLVGNAPVKDSELIGYNQWRAAFGKGEAGIF